MERRRRLQGAPPPRAARPARRTPGAICAAVGMSASAVAFSLVPALASAAPAASRSSAVSTPAPAAPVHGRMRLAFAGIRGRWPFALRGERIELRGTVTQYAPGQRVTIHIYNGSRRVATRMVPITRLRGHHGGGGFTVSYRAPAGGSVRAVAFHEPTARMALLGAGTTSLPVIPSSLSAGARGEGVRVLQRALGALHYAVPQSGYFDEATADAVIAYRKMTGLPRVDYADATMLAALQRAEGAYRVRFRWDGRHIEANLNLQVVVEVGRGGRVENIYPTSSGKPSTPTVIGHFHVYMKSAGYNSERMYDASYFTGGYAVHGYFEVPTYAASHGCLRVPELDAPALFAWMTMGTVVDVYAS
jgi:lipoprotein-anchoring transpeptidase ErfK/SrfK